MAARSLSSCDLPMIVEFIVVRRRPTSVPAVTAGAPADRRRDTGGASAGNFVICRANRAVAEQFPSGGQQASAA